MPKARKQPVVGSAACTTPDGVAALDRAIAMLGAFEGGRPVLSLAELAARTGLYKSTILRLMNSLLSGGLLERLPDGRYRVGSRLFRLGELYRQAVTPEAVLLPLMHELAERTGESAVFYAPVSESQRICLHRVESPSHALRYHVRVGETLPMGIGAPGRLLSAFAGEPGELYDLIRAAGVYAATGERDPEIAGIAAPVFGRSGVLVGTLAIAGPRSRFDSASIARMTRVVCDLAAIATTTLRG